MSKPKIIYVYDALCGWCYGFSPVIQKLFEEHKGEWDFEVISGGMITGSRIGPISEMGPYIKKAYKDVEKASGIKFGENFLKKTLEEGKAILTSEPPALAMAVFKSFKSDEAVKYASALQKAIYFDGIEPANLTAYSKYAAEFGIDEKAFEGRMKDSTYIKQALNEFEFSNKLGVTGFPTVFLEKDSNQIVISQGFCSYSELEKRIKKALDN